MRFLSHGLLSALLISITACTYNRAPEPYSGPAGYGGQVISSAPYTTAPSLPNTVPSPPPPVYYAPAGTNGSLMVGPAAPDSDAAIASRVQTALRTSRLAGITPNINVSAQNGTVTLSGFVPSESERQQAETLARNTAGVLNINNELQVVGTPTGRVTPVPTFSPGSAVGGNIFNLQVQGLDEADRGVAERVLEGLRGNPALMSTFPSVNINVTNGRVALDGQVGTEQQRQAIESVVKQAAGAANVEDHLHVMEPVTGNGQ